MKKNYFFLTLSFLTTFAIAQKAIIVNGGQFGNPAEMVNVMIYDTQLQNSVVIDTIRTNSVQDILIDGDFAYVAAQDSIVKYSLINEARVAANSFAGVSTKTMALGNNNELIVGNWYAKSSDNIYYYDQTTLALKDSIPLASLGAKSMYVDANGGFSYVTQNEQTAGFQDTLGYIIAVRNAFRTIIDTIRVPNYTGDIGEIIPKPDGTGFYTINSVSNTITTVDISPNSPAPTSVSITTSNQDFKVGNRSQFSVYRDTAFLRMNEGIGAINLTNLAVIDSLIIDTVVTAFAFDTLHRNFYLTQTNFFSYYGGRIYNRAGSYMDTLIVGFSPEVVRMYYDQTVGLAEVEASTFLNLYPNPATDFITVELDDQTDAQLLVFDINGKIVREEELTPTDTRIDLGDYRKGFYLFRIVGNGLDLSRTVIIQ